jgi:hypothetical protein
MLCDDEGRLVSASMKPLRSLTVLAGGSSRVSRSLSDGVPGAVMDMVTRVSWGVAQQQVLVSTHMAGRGGKASSLRGDAGVSEKRQEDVAPCAER